MIDHIGLLPAYLAAGTAVLALIVDLIAPGRWALPAIATALGAAVTAAAAVVVGTGDARGSFCVQDTVCSHEADTLTALVAVVFTILTLGTIALSIPVLRDKAVPAGEYCFLLAVSMTGGVMLGGARDLILLIVAVETVTIPLYALVALRNKAKAVEASLTFFITSVVATSVAMLGAGLIYAASGNVRIAWMEPTLTVASRMEGIETLIPVGIVLLLVGLAVKVAAVPVHGWAAPTYDGAPLPVAAFLSTASKFAGIVSVIIVLSGMWGQYDVAAPTMAILAVLTMTVGNLVALRQRRMVRLLAWSSIAQGGYLLAPLGMLVSSDIKPSDNSAFAATLAYTIFFIVLEFGAFAALIATRGSAGGGLISEYRGVARKSWWIGTALVLSLTGLAGLPPGVAGLFAKVAVIKGVVDGGGTWLAVIVALNAVIALSYYAKLIAVLFARPESETVPTEAQPATVVRELALVGAGGTGDDDTVLAAAPLPVDTPSSQPSGLLLARSGPVVVATVAVVTIGGLVLGFAPQLVLDIADSAAAALLAAIS